MKLSKLVASALLISTVAIANAQTFTVNNLQVNGTQTNTNPLAIGSGGTAANSAANARTNLAVPGLATSNTFTAAQTLGYSTPVFTLNDTSNANVNTIGFQSNGTTVWQIRKQSGATGNFHVARFVSNAEVDQPINIPNSTGIPIFVNGIAGTTTNNNANAGAVGEYTTATNTATSLTTGTAANCTSVSLTAGDWDVESVVLYTPTGTTSITSAFAGVSTTSAALGLGFGSYTKNTWAAMVPNNSIVVSSPVVRVSIASTTTVYAIGSSNFTASTLTCDGFIRARRVR